ncbi:hypothetical protein DPMN_034035 [Dreissena polymorpha]|uniref:Uncharacterized protein n=1 Tax=Dreissena polymorpha TaxID=45954 RepID=A0A9D4M6S6_DREPO|nr:hypothetical protein DPMN_034035 [Dreissena polymorpha]
MISVILYPLLAFYTTTSTDNNVRFLVYNNGSEIALVLAYCSRARLELLGDADSCLDCFVFENNCKKDKLQFPMVSYPESSTTNGSSPPS